MSAKPGTDRPFRGKSRKRHEDGLARRGRFVMCSTFKASLAAFVLARIDRGEDRLEDMVAYGAQDLLDYARSPNRTLPAGAMSVSDMCKAIVELSDNTCANLLLARSAARPR
jgi:beta-lactamase class A